MDTDARKYVKLLTVNITIFTSLLILTLSTITAEGVASKPKQNKEDAVEWVKSVCNGKYPCHNWNGSGVDIWVDEEGNIHFDNSGNKSKEKPKPDTVRTKKWSEDGVDYIQTVTYIDIDEDGESDSSITVTTASGTDANGDTFDSTTTESDRDLDGKSDSTVNVTTTYTQDEQGNPIKDSVYTTDFNGDGKPDSVETSLKWSDGEGKTTEYTSIDKDGDGEKDGNILKDNDGDKTTVYEDKNGDGSYEKKREDTDGDGHYDKFYIDTDGDGNTEEVTERQYYSEDDEDMEGDGNSNEFGEDPGCLDDIDCDGKPDQYDEDMDGDGFKNWEDSDSDGDNISDSIDDKYPQGPGLNNQSISAYDENLNALEMIKQCKKDRSDLLDELDKEYLDDDYSKGWYVSPQVQKEYYEKVNTIMSMCNDLYKYESLTYLKYLCSLADKGTGSWNQELTYKQACLEVQNYK